ncbi:MAG: hypothetical protein IGS48_02320 [Oscillatoriales cyanobacterium C42_A2020_001]|nr:hypothetical protein [Leptolyngbyaceae cyanobacterium C42_A2020_001]
MMNHDKSRLYLCCSLTDRLTISNSREALAAPELVTVTAVRASRDHVEMTLLAVEPNVKAEALSAKATVNAETLAQPKRTPLVLGCIFLLHLNLKLLPTPPQTQQSLKPDESEIEITFHKIHELMDEPILPYPFISHFKMRVLRVTFLTF